MPTPRLRLRRRDVLALAGVVVLAPDRVGRPQASPRAEIATPRVDLGVVALGTEPEVVFTIRNTGGRPLTLAVGRLGQGLRLVGVDAAIAPGEHGTVRVAIETFRVGATMDWTVPVTTNDPDRETVILQVHADVRTYILVTPPASRITFVQYEREGGTTHLVAAAEHEEFRVTRVESPYPFIDATVSAATGVERPDGTVGPLWAVTLTIRKQAAVGPLAANVVIHTNHPKQPKAWLPLSGFVRPVVAVTPPALTMAVGLTSDASAPAQTLAVTNFAENPLDLISVSSSLPGIQSEVVVVDAGRRWRITVRSVGDEARRPGSGVLTIRTSRADVPPTEVPVTRR
ncbi:hypothetical protein [Luteitalea sp.]